MRKFLTSILYFLIILFTINLLLYSISNKIYIGNYRNVSLNYSSYLLADSHGLPLEDNTEQYGIYNFSAGSDSYFDMLRKLYYLIHNTKVETIYITVDDHTLSPYRENLNNLDRSVIFSTPDSYNSYLKYIKERYLINNVVFFQPKARSVINNYLLSNLKDVLKYNDEMPVEKERNWNKISLENRKISAYNRFISQFPEKPYSENLIKSFIEIINLCKKNNIDLIGIKFPLSNEYIEIIGDRTFNADSVLLSHNFRVLDYKRIYCDNESYFKNQDHLNATGGKLFTEFLFSYKKN